MKIGDIDVTNSILNLEYDVNVLQQLLNHVIQNNPGLKFPSPADIVAFQENAVKILDKKYPNMGIKKQ